MRISDFRFQISKQMAALALAASTAFAGDVPWMPTGGPPGALSYDVRIHPYNRSILFLTELWTGIQFSTNQGDSWTAWNHGILTKCGPSREAIPAFALAIDPVHSNILWAGTEGRRPVHKSSDGGATWATHSNGIPVFPNSLSVMSFAIEPKNPEAVYCAIDVRGPSYDAPSTGRIYKTTDGGANWTEILATKSLVRRVLINPKDPKIVYAATGLSFKHAQEEVGILKSEDAGKTWQPINEGLYNFTVNDLIMDQWHPEVLFAATGGEQRFGNDPRGGVYRSGDAGATWELVLEGGERDFSFIVTSAALCERKPTVVYAGTAEKVYRSDDGGNTWAAYELSPPGFVAGTPLGLAVDPKDPFTVYANCQHLGFLKSTDGGRTWAVCTRGYTGAVVHALAASSANTVYAAANSGVFQTTDAGATWTGINHGALKGWELMVSIANAGDALLASSRYSSAIFKSKDGGKTWRQVHRIAGTGQTEFVGAVKALAAAPSNPKIIYAGTVNAECFEEFPCQPLPPSAGVLKSEDAGETWKAVNEGLAGQSRLNVLDVAVHPTNPDVAYAATADKGMFKTTDGGKTWAAINQGFAAPDARAIAIDAKAPDTLYVGAERGAVFKTTDGGRRWRQTALGMDPEAAVRAILVDPNDSKAVYAACWHVGIYVSRDAGASWQLSNEGLTVKAVLSFAVSPDRKTLYAGTLGGGVFRRPLGR